VELELPENIIADPGTRFVISLTFPSGKQAIIGAYEGNVAIIMIEKNKKLNNAMSWECTDDLFKWLDKFKTQVGEKEWPKWLALKPTVGRIGILQ